MGIREGVGRSQSHRIKQQHSPDRVRQRIRRKQEEVVSGKSHPHGNMLIIHGQKIAKVIELYPVNANTYANQGMIMLLRRLILKHKSKLDTAMELDSTLSLPCKSLSTRS